MEEIIKEQWDNIMMLLETQYGISDIIIKTWITTLSVHKVVESTVYFCVDESRGIHTKDYLRRKGQK